MSISSVKREKRVLWKKINKDLLLVLLSVTVQVPLAIFLGHYYDQRVFMTTGYLVGSGLDPYQQYEFVGVFSHSLLQGIIPRFGYPPPWAFILGLAFQLSYRVLPNLLLYNFASKVLIIAGNIGLAFLVKYIMLEVNTSREKAQFAFKFLLFNPFVLLTTVAWGQFDTVTTFLCIFSLYLLSKRKKNWCALSLALAISVKPIVLPLFGLPLFYEPRKWWRNLQYLIILIITIFLCSLLLFFIFNWQLPLAPNEWNAHFKAAGGLTLFSVVEILNGTLYLPISYELLGFLWIPALLIGYYAIQRRPPTSQYDLIRKAIGLMLIFFLTRSWLSEPNIILVLSLILIANGPNKTSFRNLHFVWIIPLVFMFFNYSIPSLFFIPYPAIISDLAKLDVHIRTIRLIGRFLVVVLWQYFAWSVLNKMLHPRVGKESLLSVISTSYTRRAQETM